MLSPNNRLELSQRMNALKNLSFSMLCISSELRI